MPIGKKYLIKPDADMEGFLAIEYSGWIESSVDWF